MPERAVQAAGATPASTLPVRRITLYRSGVASFERTGTVAGNTALKLRFDNDLVNDVLKSLVAVDLSGKGSVRGVSYASNAPLARRLAAFGINLGDQPSLSQLLGRLRGASVTVTGSGGSVVGTILGTEIREEAAGSAQKALQVPYLIVVTSKGIRSVSLFEARSIELTDAELQGELNKALEAIAQQRQEQSRTLDVSFNGTGEREVAVIYTHESPVWKASYRVLMGPEKPSRLSGWAIVENTTDEDWTDVRLSLVSGRPVSFTMNLQEPLFASRPVVGVPSVGGLAPRLYADAVQSDGYTDKNAIGQLARKLSSANNQQSLDGRNMAAPASPLAAGDRSYSFRQERNDEPAASAALAFKPDLATAAITSASAGLSGEVFHYDVAEPVTVARQSSAMIPIIGADIKARRVSILSPGWASGQNRYPMRGLELTNSTDLQLLPGPIAVYDDGVYAGDSMIEQIGPGDTRLLSYATDLDVLAVPSSTASTEITRLRIVQGVFEQRTTSVSRTEYKLRNKNDKNPRTLIIEHPKQAGYRLADALKPASETGDLYRFEKELSPGERATFIVTLESEGTSTIGLDSLDDRTILSWQQAGKASPAVLASFKEIAKKQSDIRTLERRKADLDAEWKRISEDQDRTRKNMSAIDRNTDLYARYMKKLGEQETQGEKIGAENIDLTDKLRKSQEDLNKYLSELNVE